MVEDDVTFLAREKEKQSRQARNRRGEEETVEEVKDHGVQGVGVIVMGPEKQVLFGQCQE